MVELKIYKLKVATTQLQLVQSSELESEKLRK